MPKLFDVIGAHPALRPAITFYYRLRQDYSVNEEWLRVDTGNLWFFLQGGDGYLEWPNGQRCPTTPLMCTGPLSASPRMRVSGPVECIGIPINPEAWGQLLGENAVVFADRAVDMQMVLGGLANDMAELLRATSDMRVLADGLDALLLPRMKPLPPSHRHLLGVIRSWLSADLFPDVEALYARCDLSSRQVMRIASQYFGGPPKLLSRKYGALRTASAILANQGRPPAEAIAHYADQSHMIRELRVFTGRTPRGLMTRGSPITREALTLANFQEIVPYA